LRAVDFRELFNGLAAKSQGPAHVRPSIFLVSVSE
jgi:hypothetical protein